MPTLKVVDSHFQNKEVSMKITLFQQLILKINGYVFVFFARKEGWSGKLPFYIVKCDEHGYFLDYPHGFLGYNEGFNCPLCLKGITERLEI